MTAIGNWPRLRYGQMELARLCPPEPFYPTEYHPQNQLYAMTTILREYADLPRDEPLPWAMEHFISFDNPEPYPPDLASELPVILAVSEGQAEALRRRGRSGVHAIGSIFYYMRQLYHRRHPDATESPGSPSGAGRRGTLVFPDKSTSNQDVDYDRAGFARWLAALPDEYQPVAVSVFWKDYLRGTYREWSEAGLMLVTSGNSYDDDFLFRQYDLCLQFRYACANDLSTSFCLSVLAGCRFFHCPTGPLQVTRQGRIVHFEQEPTLHLPEKQRCLAASRFPLSSLDDGGEQRRLAERFAGGASVRTPEFFRRLFTDTLPLLQREVPDLDFAAVGAYHNDRLAAWRLSGVDPDGWGREHVSLVVPREGGRNRLLMRVEIPGRDDATWPSRFVVINGNRQTVFRVHPGYWLLDVPVTSRAVGDHRVTLIGEGEIPLDGGLRRRSLRIHSLRRSSSASTWFRSSSPRLCLDT